MPHGMVDGSAHAAQHTRSAGAVMPGGLTHVVPDAHCEPTPVHVRHVAPLASIVDGIGSPQGTIPAPLHVGQQPVARHSSVPVQRVPTPMQSRLPMHVSGTSTPQSTMSGVTHASVHSHTPAMHARPAGHGPMQWPPQPSSTPHIASGAHVGMHSQRPVSGLHSSCAPGQVPVQKPPQPSGVPHAASAGQRGMQTHAPPMQRSGSAHAGSQPHVSTHMPF
jgi:hypothetical protein